MGAAFDDGLARLDEVVADHVGDGGVPGAAWLVARGGEVHTGAAGTLDGERPVTERTIFRISSTTKPLTAVATMVLVDDGTLALDDPIDDLVPELADRQVLVRPDGPLDETVPADRPVTMRDLLTFRMGWGFDFASEVPHTVLGAMAARGLQLGPPAPGQHLATDEWLAVLEPLPLSFQPGARWLYHLSAEVLGVVVGRAAGSSLGTVLADRVFAPLGMADTGFWVPPHSMDRFGPCYWSADAPMPGSDPAPVAGIPGVTVYDATDGQWADPPAFEDGGAGLVSTIGDLATFAEMLLGGGETGGVRVLSTESVAAMTTDHLGSGSGSSSGSTSASAGGSDASGGPDPTGDTGWGFGMAVRRRAQEAGPRAGAYGWDGGLGSSWANDPEVGLAGVLLTNLAWSSPERPAICEQFWAATYAAVSS
jgi:CubicO group peptidase (beta-lactamase class C family)